MVNSTLDQKISKEITKFKESILILFLDYHIEYIETKNQSGLLFLLFYQSFKDEVLNHLSISFNLDYILHNLKIKYFKENLGIYDYKFFLFNKK